MKKVIPNTDGIYFADTDGNIYKNEKQIGMHLDRKENGYLQCAVKINGKYQKQKVHRLVASAFIGDINNLTVNHKNGIKTDNRPSNLEIISNYENVQHSKKLDSFKAGKKKAGLSQRALSREDEEKLKELKDKKSLTQLGKIFNVRPSTISTYIKRMGLTRKKVSINQYV